MLYKNIIVALSLMYFVHLTTSCGSEPIRVTNSTKSTPNLIPYRTRAYWMRRANQLLSELVPPCPFAPFAAVIVNHTSANNGLGELICSGVNRVGKTGNPIMHGEMVAISNCSAILTDKDGRYRLSPRDAVSAFSQFSIYSNAVSCPMCASAIRWSRFKEYIYGTSINTLTKEGWDQIQIDSRKLFSASDDLELSTDFIPNVLSNETDPHFMWQFNSKYPCPVGCQRNGDVCFVAKTTTLCFLFLSFR